MEAWGPETGAWRVVSLGLRAMKRRRDGLETPSNHFMGRFGEEFDEHRRVSLDPASLGRILAGESLPSEGLPVGPVALTWEGRVLGRGMVGRSGLRSEIGKAEAKRLRAVVETTRGDASK